MGVELEYAGRVVYLAALPPGRVSRVEMLMVADSGAPFVGVFVGVASWAALNAELRWFGLPSLVAIDFDYLESGVWRAVFFSYVPDAVSIVVLTDHVDEVSELLGSLVRVMPKSSDLYGLFDETRRPEPVQHPLLRRGGTGTKV